LKFSHVTYDLFESLKRFNECRGYVVDCQNDLSDASLGEGLDLVAEDGLVSEEDEGLRY